MSYKIAVKELKKTWKHSKILKGKPPRVRQGDIFLAKLHDDLDELFPVVVVQTDKLNRLGFPSTIVVPCAKHKSKATELRHPIPSFRKVKFGPLTCMIDSLRMVNLRRLKNRIGCINETEIRMILKKVKRVLGRDPC